MKVRLTQGLFQRAVYDLEAAEDALTLSGEGCEPIVIPLSSVRDFDVYGTGSACQHFTLDTTGGLYEGDFLRREDVELLLHLLCKENKGYMNIRLERQ